jgi:hypothetical protein
MPKRKPASSQSGDVDALAFDPDDTRDPRSKAFISREGSRKRGLEIAFDPEKHKCAFWILPWNANPAGSVGMHLCSNRNTLVQQHNPRHPRACATYWPHL